MAPRGGDSGEATLREAALREVNLLRVRGALGDAKGAAMRVLEAHPNDAETKALLGEICREAGEPEEAERWYGLALADDPATPIARRRLGPAAVLDAGRFSWWVPVTAVVILLLLLGAYRAGGARERSRIGGRILAPAPNSPEPPAPSVETPTPSAPTADSASLLSLREAEDLTKLQEAGDAGRGVIGLQHDPRTGAITLSVRVGVNDPPRRAAEAAARLAYATFASAPTVSVRVLRGGELVFEGSSARPKEDAGTNAPANDANSAANDDPASGFFDGEWSADTPTGRTP